MKTFSSNVTGRPGPAAAIPSEIPDQLKINLPVLPPTTTRDQFLGNLFHNYPLWTGSVLFSVHAYFLKNFNGTVTRHDGPKNLRNT